MIDFYDESSDYDIAYYIVNVVHADGETFIEEEVIENFYTVCNVEADEYGAIFYSFDVIAVDFADNMGDPAITDVYVTSQE